MINSRDNNEKTGGPHGFGAPDPSLATKEEIAVGRQQIEDLVRRNRDESKGWIDSLQTLLEEKIRGSEDKTANLDRVVQTRLGGSETALNAAMAAADKVTQEIKINFGGVMAEMRAGVAKQMESLSEKIDDLKERMSESGGHKQGTSQMIAWIIAAIAALAAVAMFVTVLSRPSPEVHVTGSVAQPQQPQHMIGPRI
jgi:hypothetical protein